MSSPPRPPRGVAPRVVIVGRPNVGKSTLLNRMANSRVSIVEPTAGVTRDRVSVPVRLDGPWGERWLEVIDTGGIGIVDRDDLGAHVEEQVRVALRTADLVLFVVDARDGVTPLDGEVARRLRGFDVPVVLVANKAEGDRPLWEVDTFRRLGVGVGPFAISAQNGEGLSELYDRVHELLPPDTRTPEEVAEGEGDVGPLKVAIVGRRNAGKSTLVNALAGEERMIVSEIPGTTRDAVDVLLERDGRTWIAIDTAGVRKKKSFEDAVEFYGDARSHRAIRRADVTVLLFDATEDLSALDKRLVRYVVDHHKPLILAANKQDLVGDRMVSGQLREYIDDTLPGVRWAPLHPLSAKLGRGVPDVLHIAARLHAESQQRVPTAELNRILQAALEARSPSSKGYRVRLRYATQARGAPPTFVLFVNDKRLIGQSYLRYLENRLREELPFKEVPMHIVLRDEKTAAETAR